MVTQLTIDRPAHRIHQQAARHRLGLDRRVQFDLRRERRLRLAVPHEFQRQEQPAPADIAHVFVRAKRIAQHLPQQCAPALHLRQQVVTLDHLLHRQRRRCRHRVADIRVPVLEHAAALAQRVDDRLVREHCADRLVAGAQALGHGHDVRRHALLPDRVHAAGAAHAAHDFIGDEQDAVPVADIAHALEVARRGRDRAAGGAHHRLGDESDDGVRPGLDDGRFEFVEQAGRVVVERHAFAAAPVGVTGRDAQRLLQQRGKGALAPLVAAHAQRAQRVAVVALAARDELRALRLARLDPVLARQLERGLHRFRTARDEIHAAHVLRPAGDQAIGQLLGHFGGEERGVGIGAAVDLAVHGRNHVRVAMAQRRHGRAAAGVEVGLAGAVAQHDAGAANRRGRHLAQVAVDDVAHGRLPRR